MGIYQDMVWPAMEQVSEMYKDDRINMATEHMATRINRVVADQLQAHLPKSEQNGKRIIITCADDEPEEFPPRLTVEPEDDPRLFPDDPEDDPPRL